MQEVIISPDVPESYAVAADLEREAFVRGDSKMAGLYAAIATLSSEVESLEGKMEKEAKNAYVRGHRAGKGVDISKEIDTLEAKVETQQQLIAALHNELRLAMEFLNSPDSKNIPNRKARAVHIQRRLIALR